MWRRNPDTHTGNSLEGALVCNNISVGYGRA